MNASGTTTCKLTWCETTPVDVATFHFERKYIFKKKKLSDASKFYHIKCNAGGKSKINLMSKKDWKSMERVKLIAQLKRQEN